VSQMNSKRAHVIKTYRARARHYDRAMNLYHLIGFRQWAYRSLAVQALRLREGDTVVEIGCGTGLNFSLIEQVIGPTGRIIGIDLTDAMLAQARLRVEKHGWNNVSFVQADAVEFQFPADARAILSTFALLFVPECAEVIARGSMALSPGGCFVVLDLKLPEMSAGWLAPVQFTLLQGLLPLVRPFAVTEEVTAHRPWEATRAAMQAHLTEYSWTELFFGFAFLAAGTRKRGDC
jgi:ubiquinone/menaquinone biosynthesis C-methylase UbiE